MNEGYDLKTVVQAVRKCKETGDISIHLHFAGTGSQEPALKQYCQEHQLLSHPAVVTFHGQLDKKRVNELLLNADIGLVANKPETLVACPYKAAEYAAAGLPILSCLEGGELHGQLLREYNAGSEYKEGDVDSLYSAIEKCNGSIKFQKKQSKCAKYLAEKLFNQSIKYKQFANYMIFDNNLT